MTDATLIDSALTFASFSNLIDSRLLRSLADMGFVRPTLVQAKAIPLALEGRDILARARTGSGKTAAYCIPVVQKILNAKAVCLFNLNLYFYPDELMRTLCPLSNFNYILLLRKNLSTEDPSRQAVRAMILVPTKELSEQVTRQLGGLLAYCDKEVVMANLSSGTATQLQRYVDQPIIL